MAKLETHELLKERLSHKEGMHQITEQESRAIKAVILEIALDVVGLCRELGIPYMLGGGAALGAVRHHGFIPWDDDLDLNIPRKYIGRLLSELRVRYGDKYELEVPLETEGYLSSFIQVHRKDTVFREHLAQKPQSSGIKIDIFVIENTYDSRLRRLWHGLRIDSGLFLLSCYRMFAWRKEYTELSEGDAAARRTIRIKQLIGAPIALAPRFFYRRLQHCMQQCRDAQSRYVTIPSGRKHFFGELYERRELLPTQEMEFEGHLFSVTRGYDAYLSRLYGDYMTLPPEEKREQHVLYDLKLPGEIKAPRLLERREVQQVLLDMLDLFVKYCEKHGLRYYLVGGTLLGAVRHHGFIPWDDDIDVGMPRRDYERFLKLVETEPVAPHLQAISAKAGTLSNPYCELLHMGTELERDTSKYIREECQILHLFIDIFPQDGWPESDRAARILSKYMDWNRYLVLCGRAKLGKGVSIFRMLAKAPVVFFMKLVGYKRILRHMDRVARHFDYDTSRYVGAITYGIYGPGERCLREDVVNFQKMDFEGRSLCVPGCWDSYLHQIYGDYMTLPPEEKRKTHRLRVWLKEH